MWSLTVTSEQILLYQTPTYFIGVLYNISDSYLLQVNEKFHKLERVYRDCIKMTRNKTRIYSIPHDTPGT